MQPPQISIDQELRDLIHPLSQEELSLLHESLKRDGCLSPVIVWQQGNDLIMLDGHNRFPYCQEQGIKFQVAGVKLSSKEEAKLWILTNQLGRRNLSDSQRAILAAKRAILLGEESNKEKMKIARAAASGVLLGDAGVSIIERPKVRIRPRVAKEAGLPEQKVAKAMQLVRKNPVLAGHVLAGTLSLTEAHHQVSAPAVTKPNPGPTPEEFQIQKLRADLQAERALVQDFKRLVEAGIGDSGRSYLSDEMKDLYDRLMK